MFHAKFYNSLTMLECMLQLRRLLLPITKIEDMFGWHVDVQDTSEQCRFCGDVVRQLSHLVDSGTSQVG